MRIENIECLAITEISAPYPVTKRNGIIQTNFCDNGELGLEMIWQTHQLNFYSNISIIQWTNE